MFHRLDLFVARIAGTYNKALNYGSSVFGGELNVNDGQLSVIVGGAKNTADGFGHNAVLVGGKENAVFYDYSVQVGGEDHYYGYGR